MGTGSFLRVKRPERGVDHQPPSRAEVKGRIPLFPFSAFMAGYKANITVASTRQLLGFLIQKIRPGTEKYKTKPIKIFRAGHEPANQDLWCHKHLTQLAYRNLWKKLKLVITQVGNTEEKADSLSCISLQHTTITFTRFE